MTAIKVRSCDLYVFQQLLQTAFPVCIREVDQLISFCKNRRKITEKSAKPSQTLGQVFKLYTPEKTALMCRDVY